MLEAIHTLSLGKSFRTHMQKSLIKNGEDGFLIKGHFFSKRKESVIATQLIKKGSQQTKINGKKITTRKSLIGKNNVVLLFFARVVFFLFHDDDKRRSHI